MRIEESIDRVMRSQDVFGAAFYDIFFQRAPEMREFFRDVDMNRQSIVLTMSISLIGQNHSRRYPATERYLHYLGTQHRKWDIPRSAFPKWREAMIEALGGFHGEDWSEELAAEWRAAFDGSIAAMFDGYEHDFNV